MATAQDDEKFSLSLGVFFTDQNSETRVDASGGGEGTPVDLEKDLGLNKSDSVFRIDGYYRFSDKHRIDFSVFDLSRTNTRQIQRQIEWDGTVFPIDTTVLGKFDQTIYKLAYTWSFLRRESGYLGLTAGLYIADFGAELSATSIAGVAGGAVTAPLPVVGLRGMHRFNEKWSLRASGEFFSLKYQDYDGSLTDLYVGVDYKLSERGAIGLGLNSVGMDISVEKPELKGKLDWRYDGAMLFYKHDF